MVNGPGGLRLYRLPRRNRSRAAAWAAGYARRTVGRLASQELPPATVGGNWLEVPQIAETDDGFPADTAALRAAYVLGRVVDAGLVQSLVQMLVVGAQQTFKPPPPPPQPTAAAAAGSGGSGRRCCGVVHSYNASYALQHICTLRPELVQECDLSIIGQLCDLLTSRLPPSSSSSFDTADRADYIGM